MSDEKSSWKIKTIRQLQYETRRLRLLKFMGIIYHTVIPIVLTYMMMSGRNLFLILPILFIIFVRIEIK